MQERIGRLLAILFLVAFGLVSSPADSQYRYSKTDVQNIIVQRKAMDQAMKDWNKRKLYQLGLFFEKIYNRYSDTSMGTAIACFHAAASSESEYGHDWHSYAAARKLGQIYETGKTVTKDLQKAVIYYYLGDTSQNYPGLQLRNLPQNRDFQRVKKMYCNDSIVLANTIGQGNGNDSLVLSVFPFCDNKVPAYVINSLVQVLREHPEYRIKSTICGQSPVTAAQYFLIAENYSLPRVFERFKIEITDKHGISADRFMPLLEEFNTGQAAYKLVIYIGKGPGYEDF